MKVEIYFYNTLKKCYVKINDIFSSVNYLGLLIVTG